MPWNPLLPMQVQPPQAPASPMQTMADMFQLRRMETANRQDARAERQQALADEDDQWFRQQVQTNLSPDGQIQWKAIERNALKDGKINVAMKAGEQHEKVLAATRKQYQDELEFSGKFWEQAGDAARAIESVWNNPDLPEPVRRENAERLYQANIKSLMDTFGEQAIGPLVQQLPPNFDPAVVNGIALRGMSAREQIDYLGAGTRAANDAITRKKNGLEYADAQRKALANTILGLQSPEDLVTVVPLAKDVFDITDKALYDSLGIGDFFNGAPTTMPTAEEFKAIQAKARPFRMDPKDIEASEDRSERSSIMAERADALAQAATARIELARVRGDEGRALAKELANLEVEEAKAIALQQRSADDGGFVGGPLGSALGATTGAAQGESSDVQAIRAAFARARRLLQGQPEPKADEQPVTPGLAGALPGEPPLIVAPQGQPAPAAVSAVAPQSSPKATPARKKPTVGERRRIQGQLAEWDGQGWVAVRN